MEKKDLKKLALMGITGALIISSQAGLEANNDSTHATMNHIFSRVSEAQHACGGKSCGGIVAENDNPTSTKLVNPAKDSKDSTDSEAKDKDNNSGNLGYHLMTEQELLIELNDEGKALYNKLTPEGKELARKVASARCNGTNECRGLNACLTDKNDCAGKGACKGQGKCAMADKNLAVKLVSDKMAGKRNDATEK